MRPWELLSGLRPAEPCVVAHLDFHIDERTDHTVAQVTPFRRIFRCFFDAIAIRRATHSKTSKPPPKKKTAGNDGAHAGGLKKQILKSESK